MQAFNVQFENWQIRPPAETTCKRNNDKKKKQTDVLAVHGLGTSSLWWEELVNKVGFEPVVKKKLWIGW